MSNAKRIILAVILLIGQTALAYDFEKVQRQIDGWGHDFSIAENWVTQLDSIERLRLGGALAPLDPPIEPTWRPDGPKELRAYLDWRDHNYGNYVSGIRQQGSCGSCWAFASVALLESMKMISWTLPGTDPDYSEQYVLSCSDAGDCDSGNAHQALEFLSDTGTPPEACFPYEGDDGVPCGASCPETEEFRNRLVNVSYVTLDNVDIEVMKAALEDGPLVTFMQVYENFYGYDEGIYSAYGSDYTGVNHSVLIIGYDESLECWSVKNSWGTGWGEGGFFRIAFDSGCSFGFWTQTANYRAPYEGPNWYVATDGDDVYNNGSAEQPFASISRGGYRVSADDSVLVAPGHYSSQQLHLNKQFVLAAQGTIGEVILDNAQILAFGSTSPKVLELSFQGASSSPGVIFESSPIFEKCVFSVDPNYPISIMQNAAPIFRQCSFANCQETLFDMAPDGSQASIQFDACIIAYNEARLLLCGDQPNIDMSCSLMWENAGGDYSGCFEGFEDVNNNIQFYEPQFCDVESGDITLFLGSICLPDHNDCGIQIGAYGLGCGGEVLHVSVSGSDTEGDGSEQDPWQSIMWAVTQSAYYDTVLVHPGTYSGPMNTGIGFLGKPLALVGAEGPGATVIDCQSVGRAVNIDYPDYWQWKGERLIQGLTIKNGLASSGGGAYVQGSVDFVDCHFIDNRAIEGGGGLYYSPWDSISIRSCLFEGNEAGGGGALHLMFPSYVSIEECVFHDNLAEHGGAIQATGYPSLPVSELLIRSSTFALNTAVQGSQMSFCTNPYEEHSFEVRIESSILSYGIGSQPIVEYCPPNIVLDVQCSDIFGHESGDYVGLLSEFEGLYGNISEEPLFCSMDDGDFTLNDISPCLPENNDCGLLMGALPQGCTYPVTTPEDPPGSGIALEAYPNPFNPELMVVFSLPTSSDVDCRIYDLAGREVRTLLEKSPWDAGIHEIKWDGRDDLGRSSASGIYFVRLNASTERLTRKVTLLK